MYLAWKELTHNKGKFALIIVLVTLISYLVYFLTSLAYGLASSYTNGVTKWQADNIVLNYQANDNIMMSYLSDDEYDRVEASGEKAKLGFFPAIIGLKDATSEVDTRQAVYVFGIEDGSFLAPSEYSLITLPNGMIMDQSIKDEGYNLGDTIEITRTNGDKIEWVIQGFTEKATYQTAPIIYTSMDNYRLYAFGTIAAPVFSAIVVRGSVNTLGNGATGETLVNYDIQTFISTLPGYTAQVLTFSLMIGFLIMIVAFVLGIFIYVLTIQKINMFGVMKAQGISNRFIASSVIWQTLILVLLGMVVGLALTIVSGIFLAGIVPFATNVLFYIVISAGFIIFSVIGGLFSVRAVTKIDPLKAIGA
ncbi:MAG TPA: FtsX-like permease family protein [Bacilli bacterium]|nr:FtsX-like permease family protein [Bacilli bacterium]